ncbi:MAG: 30S ribosomal protein S8 [Candidatus Uhrbacteria bacterium GW2011_GWA2_53_10]|uniref:Small ribosomal subunit protein uS8 n=1 Tax=Candidatus Uhrbacteria bacterium GW2011_GWA2_53_10 TaxID=1618980 RepID=A0A0G1XQX2_9BACT|nr:MAG: 30S ribosomal protein S8 [Candidatus Uhrbacteria bacterium GW2011_GWA2_53_10]
MALFVILSCVVSVSANWPTVGKSLVWLKRAGNFMLTDPISDMLTRLRNAIVVGKREVVLPYSAMKFSIAKILEKEGYVAGVEKLVVAKRSMLRLGLQYDDTQPRLREVKRISKPGARVYAKSTELPRVLSDLGIAIISTPNGLMTNKEARARHLGGEVICEVS